MNRSAFLRTVFGSALIGLGAAALTGCVVAPVGPYRGYGPAYGGYEGGVAVAPPPLQVEAYGALPFPGAIWIGGNWGWSGGRHVWSPGRWSAPRQGYRWEPHRWERQGGRDGGWRERPGRWERR